MERRLPAPCVVVLVGPSGAGKSSWAAANFHGDEIVSSDRLRAVVGEGEHDQKASDDAFALLDEIVRRRLGRRLTTVIDTTGLDADRRAAWIAAAREAGVPVFAVPFATPAAVCRQRNRDRTRSVPVRVLDAQLRSFREVHGELGREGFDDIVDPDLGVAAVPPSLVAAPAPDATEGAVAGARAGLAFGLQIPDVRPAGGAGEIGDGLAAIAEVAERAGFRSLWVMDHLLQIPLVGAPWLDMLESYTTLAYLAGRTRTLRLGALVTGITYRNPAHLAKIVATLDVLSNGRAECGLGAAWFEHEHRAYGYAFPPLAERYDRLEDALRLLPQMWAKGSKPFHGRTIELPETTCYPRPVQPKIPILVGGGGERRTLRLVAQYADACNLIGERELVERKVAVLRRHCADVGRDSAEIRVTQLSTTLVGATRAEVAELVDAGRGRTGRERYARQTNAGTVDDHLARFSALAAAGVDEAIVSLPDLGQDAVARFGAVIDGFG